MDNQSLIDIATKNKIQSQVARTISIQEKKVSNLEHELNEERAFLYGLKEAFRVTVGNEKHQELIDAE